MFTCCPSMPSSCRLGHNFCRTLGYAILVVVSSSASDFGSPIVTKSAIVDSCGMGSRPSSRASISIVGNPNQKFGCGVSWNKDTANFCFDFFSPLSFEFMCFQCCYHHLRGCSSSCPLICFWFASCYPEGFRCPYLLRPLEA